MTSVLRANIWQDSNGIPRQPVINVYRTAVTPTVITANNIGNENGMAITNGVQIASLTVTPVSVSSRFFIYCSAQIGGGAGSHAFIALFRNSLNLQQRAYYTGGGGTGSAMFIISNVDSPATTASINYTIRAASNNGSTTQYFGQYYFTGSDTRQFGEMIIMEFAV
jgi:hypothetical protein